MTAAQDIATTYDVLLYADAETRIGLDRRWLIAGSHASRGAAAAQYSEMSAEFPTESVKILMVASVHDEATGRFRDRIIQARGLAPLIDRRHARKITVADRQRLAKALCPPMRAARPKAPPPPSTPGWVWWFAGITAGAGATLGYLLR